MHEMARTAKVWMVHLERGLPPVDHRGRIELLDDALVFTHSKTQSITRFEYASIDRAKRNRGTPILMLEWRDGDRRRSTAFYFVPPPPLEADAAPRMEQPSPFGFGRTSARRQRKTNARFLTTTSGMLKPEIRAWAQELSERTRGG
jgi:hypothetical protein